MLVSSAKRSGRHVDQRSRLLTGGIDDGGRCGGCGGCRGGNQRLGLKYLANLCFQLTELTLHLTHRALCRQIQSCLAGVTLSLSRLDLQRTGILLSAVGNALR